MSTAVTRTDGVRRRQPRGPRLNGTRGTKRASDTKVHIVVATTTPILGAGLEAALAGARPRWIVSAVVNPVEGIDHRTLESASLLVANAPLDALAEITSENRTEPRVPLILLTSDDDARVEADLLRAGAMGVLPITVDPATLVRAAEGALAGRSTVSPEAIRQLSEPIGDAPTITSRQREVLEALAEGLSTREIATALVLTESTVKTHIGRLAARFAASGRSELQRLAPRILSQRGHAAPDAS
jgi:DNA-binding NarL/FixJ family response regulator